MGFQKTMNRDLPIGVAGDFASTNPYHSMLAGEGQFTAGDKGVTVGRFAWADNDTGAVLNVKSDDARLGFVYRDQSAIITAYLAESSMVIPTGLGVTLYDGGDFFASFAAGASIGQKVFASDTDGTAKASSSATEAGYTDTGFTVASKAAAGAVAMITK